MSRTKKYKYRIDWFRFLLFLLLLFSAIAGLVYKFLISEPSPYITLTTGSLKHEKNYPVIVMRNEKVIENIPDGKVTYFFSEGEIVSKEDLILSIAEEADLQQSASNEERGAPESFSGRSEVASGKLSTDIKLLQDGLDTLKQDLMNAVWKKDFEKASLLKADYQAKLERFEKSLKHSSGLNSQILDAQSSVRSETGVYNLYSPVSGRISYKIDGYETLLSLSNLYRVSYSDLFRTISPMQTSPSRGSMKIVDPSAYYLIAEIPMTDFNTFQQSSVVSVLLSGETGSGKVQDVFSDGDRAIVLIRMRDFFADLYTTRYHEAKIVIDDHKGLVLPLSAIVRQEERTGVLEVQKDNTQKFVPVNVIHYGEKEAVIEMGSFYDPKSGLVKTVEVGSVIVRVPK